MQNSPVLALPYIQPAQAQKHVTHNEALRTLDCIVQLSVVSRAVATPPSTPATGTRYIVGAAASGDWAGHENAIALFDGMIWSFVPAVTGWQAYVTDEAAMAVYDGTGWTLTTDGITALQNMTAVGVNTTADATNPLASSGDATLLTHAGSDHRLKLNKATAPDTASLLFQTGFTGHAEMGLAGSDSFDIRVSADGSTWNTGLRIDAATAVPHMPQGLEVSGALAGSGVVGTVSHTGGVSDGAVIETGSTADGYYVRFADGTQICTHTLDLTFSNVQRLAATWTYPIGFVAGQGVSVSMSVASEFSATPAPEDLGWMGGRVGNGQAENAISLRIYRHSGGADFASGDVMTVYASAVGRWR